MTDRSAEPNQYRRVLLTRILGLYILLAVWILVLVGRLGYLQILRVEEYRIQGEEQRVGFVELSPRRGDILDRRLEELAVSVKVDSVFAHPREVREPLKVSRALAPILQQHEQDIYESLISDRAFVYLARRIPPRQSEQIRNLGFKGVYFQEETERFYPGKDLGAHVLGFVGVDNEGLAGLEYLYNDLIKGEKTRVHLRVDARRHSYQSDLLSGQSSGNTLILNLDQGIQFIAQQVLSDAVRKTEAQSGSAIVLEPYSGEVLAMASYPLFNPNRYSDYSAEERRNRAILDIYEPGSTFKVVTFSGVLNEGLGDPSELIDCQVGSLRIAGKTYREAASSFGLLTFNQVLAKSSNVGTIKLGLRLGEERLYSYIKRFGFGEKTGVDLPGEQAGLLRPPGQWSKISIGSLSIGQEVGVTPLQLVTGMAAIANGGNLVTPTIVRRILDPHGDPVFEPQVRRRRILEPGTADRMKEALGLVVREGTGRNARLNGYSSGGKTGTAQKFIDGEYSHTRYVASYAGFAPLREPRVAAIVVLNEPKGSFHGGQVAGPAFKELVERTLIYLRVPQDEASYPETNLPDAAPMELAAAEGVSMGEERIPIEEFEDTVLTLIRKEGANQKQPTRVSVSTNLFPLPDFTGMSLREVARDLTRLGLRLKVIGSGVAVGQRPPPDTVVSKDMLCEVYFSNKGGHGSTRTALGISGSVASQSN